MSFVFFALASSQWGVARPTTDSIALLALAILVSLPIILLKDKGSFKSLWAKGNALSKY
tara:strand:- start:343 stop:519 length:177 start_codon:yes stop_codon:yes gene_type:complete